MKVLVTGGLGYIGSHTCVELSKKYSVVNVGVLQDFIDRKKLNPEKFLRSRP